jgi:hypothetical protein
MKRFSFLILSLVLVGCKQMVVEAPRGFAELETENQYAAMSPEGMIYRVRLVKNSPEQSLDFWTEALTTHLRQQGYVPDSADNGFDAGELRGLFSEWTVPYGSDTYKYLTGVLVSKQAIAVAEAAGSHLVYAKYREALLESLATIRFQDVRAKRVTEEDLQSASAAPVQRPASSGCFLAGTPVLTQDGATSIEEVWPGTPVCSYDPSTGAWTQQEVMRTVSLPYSGDVVTIGTGGREIQVTGNHPFLVARGSGLDTRPLPAELSPSESTSPVSGRWVEARQLREGDTLLALDGQPCRIESVSTRRETTQVHYLAISGPHTYAVHTLGIVVHNGGSKESAAKRPLESDRAAKEREMMAAGVATASLPTDARNERVRVYSGACTIVLDNVEQAKRQISDMAEKVGGYVEQSSDTGIVIRVPAASFRSAFEEVLNLGEVLHKAIETYDVTDQFTDPAGRLAVAIKARDRLYALLKKVEDVKERLEILKKIREYTETIERLDLSLQVLEQRIAMSRITVELRSRLAAPQGTEKPIPFDWIARLHPLYASTADLRGKVTVPLPDDVALFQQKGVLRAEAADGTRIRVGTVKNDPRGDAAFWQQALVYHLKGRYEQATETDLGAVKAALFTSKDRNPFYYLVGAMPLPREPTLVVFEVYFPTEAARARHLEDLLAAFRKVEAK